MLEPDEEEGKSQFSFIIFCSNYSFYSHFGNDFSPPTCWKTGGEYVQNFERAYFIMYRYDDLYTREEANTFSVNYWEFCVDLLVIAAGG